MRDATPQTIYLSAYTPFPWDVESVHLSFALSPGATRVRSKITFASRAGAAPGPFFLHGESLKRIAATINGAPAEITETDGGITCPVPEGRFVWECEVEIDPGSNTALDGLYMSNGMYCTQCEAEGFRKITYYPDRPDVMAVFTVRVEADLPILLSNGNPAESGPGWAEWHDPWPKPAYLFALVAGDLVAHSDRFTTSEGRNVALNIWVRPGDEDRCAYAMDALKRSMIWDEQTYGLAYDLDVFNIVAVDDFNMGAMENKGLNIFNSKYVLALPETATDRDYELIEGIIAHEYFHNWTGNRITCRDWFQLCLKEGLTVFRDQQFSGDMRSKPVKRIDDVLMLRARQFREDAGPLAHPVRPDNYIEINNFYTATVYEKGAEVIGMLKLLVGEAGYAKALKLYFERHDGDAATIEDWLKVFEDATGRDLRQFKRWYTQAGTPRLTVSEDFTDDIYTITVTQNTPATPGQPDKKPMVIPLALGLLDQQGKEVMRTRVMEFTKAEQSFIFTEFSEKPVPSLLRGFSAPVILERETDEAERAFLLAYDTDPFNRWEAGRHLTKDTLARMVTDGVAPKAAYLDALERMAADENLDPAFRALALRLPSVDDMVQSLHAAGHVPDPSAIYSARRDLMAAVAEHGMRTFAALYSAMQNPGPFSPDAADAGRRDLRLTALGYLSHIDACALARDLFDGADNMTESFGALGILVAHNAADTALDSFYARWSGDRLVMDKWFALQCAGAPPARAAAVTAHLTEHGDFDWKNPNRFRSVLGAFTGNTAGFHDASGAGYRLLGDWLIKLDAVNPQTTARLSTAFETWALFDADRQGMIREQLERILARPGLSRDTTEMMTRILGDAA